MRIPWRLAAVTGLLIALAVPTAYAQEADTTKPAAAPDTTMITPASIDAGRKIFHGSGSCSACHGDKLQGGPIAPSLLGPRWRHIDGSLPAIVQRITSGLPGTLMVARPGGINESQILMVATYIYAVSHGRVKP